MTNQREPGHAGTELREIEITPEMIEAGAQVLRFAGAELSDGGREAAEDVLLAMLQLKPVKDTKKESNGKKD